MVILLKVECHSLFLKSHMFLTHLDSLHIGQRLEKDCRPTVKNYSEQFFLRLKKVTAVAYILP